MNKIVTVAAREFVETVKTRTFLFSSLAMPLLILGMVFGTEKISELADEEQMPMQTIAVADETGKLLDALQSHVAQHNEQNPKRPMAIERITPDEVNDALLAQIGAGERYAYVRIPSGALTGAEPVEVGRADSQLQAGRRIEKLVTAAFVDVRFSSAQPPIDPEFIRRLQAPPAFKHVDTKSGLETTGNQIAQFMTPFAFMFLLFMGTMNISQGLLTSLIEEKSSRVVEVLLSAISPTQLLAGKILGMVTVGALLMTIWGLMGFFAARHQDVGYLVTPFRLTYMVLYFIPGFLLYAATLAAIGSACNTIKDAQSMVWPMTLMTIVPMMMWWYITENPTSILSIVLSYIPPITPFVMILRICADPDTPLVQTVSTLVLLWASVFGTTWAAGKVFRVGVLMHGKPPSITELIRWIRVA